MVTLHSLETDWAPLLPPPVVLGFISDSYLLLLFRFFFFFLMGSYVREIHFVTITGILANRL